MTLEELEKRVRVLEDIEAIKSMHREYAFWLINHQWSDMVECFTDNATAVIATNPPCKGKKEIAKLFTGIFAKVIPWDEGHVVAQPVISVEGDKAKGHWILFVFYPEHEGGKWLQARYDCEYAKVDGKWKFSSLIFQAPWPVLPES
jgi:ketosteroid isomerase-like protein